MAKNGEGVRPIRLDIISWGEKVASNAHYLDTFIEHRKFLCSKEHYPAIVYLTKDLNTI